MEILQQIIKTLNLIDVRGADNLDRLLGCIQGLERLNAAFEAQEAKADDNSDQPEQNVCGKMD